MTTNAMWNVNLALLQDNPHTAAVLLALTHVNGMVSVDSVKYASNPKSTSMTIEALTNPHVDIYKELIERCKAMIVAERPVRLRFVADSHLLKEVCEVTGLTSSSGYFGIKDEAVCEAFSKGWIAPPSRSLVIWGSGLYTFRPQPKSTKMRSCLEGEKIRQTKRGFVLWLESTSQSTWLVVIFFTLQCLPSEGMISDMHRRINEHCTKL